MSCAADEDGGLGPALDPEPQRAETRVDVRCRSLGALAESDPFVWIQLLDDRGAFLTHDTFLGRGVGMEYRFRARIEVPTLPEPHTGSDSADRAHAPRGHASRPRLASGLHARIVTRTYRNPSGPRYQTEVLALMLMDAGAALPGRAMAG